LAVRNALKGYDDTIRSSIRCIQILKRRHQNNNARRHDKRNRFLTFKVRSASSPPPGSLTLVGNSYFLLNVAPSSTNLRFLSYPGHGLPSFSQRAQAGCLLSHYSRHCQHKGVQQVLELQTWQQDCMRTLTRRSRHLSQALSVVVDKPVVSSAMGDSRALCGD